MKSATSPKNFPNSPEAWEKLIADAPGEDRPLTREEAARRKNAVVGHSLPELREKLAVRRRGAQKAPTKIPTTIRFDADVLAELKASGRGWQTRVNDAVREWLKAHSPV
ncbi:MAG: hypothetical protein A3F73_07725 [Gallionellales bacterium RIFCSPLOWO2_12_FULL_59_22]|nr:MAG: hypothetical protein A3F73_07725 [Gallionellales bacterium RIFCSPLOWO2_12_FULL_59_22]